MLSFLVHVLRYGRLHNGVYDFQQERQRLLAGMEDILKSHKYKAAGTGIKGRSRLTRTLVAEAAFVKSNIPSRGRHLSTADDKLRYVRIPKAASTALCGTILRDRFPPLQTRTLSAGQINAITDVCLEETVNAKVPAEFFTVVRNPFSRIVSVYRELFERRQGNFLYEDYLLGILKPHWPFREFVKIACAIPDVLKDQHFKPQSCLLSHYDKRRVGVHVLKLEEPATIRDFLLAHGLNLADIRRSEPYDYSLYYDGETLETVRAAYKRDILRFGYEDVYHDLRSTVEQRGVQI